MRPRISLLAFAVLAVVGTAMPVHAQSSAGPLRLVVGYAPGGASDRAARLVAQGLQSQLGMSVIVENKPGAGGRLAAQQLRTAGATENVLMLANPAVMTIAPVVFKDNHYDPDTDFVPVAQVMSYEFAVAVGPAVPARDLAALLDWIRGNPSKAFFGVPATGSLPHFFALMLGDQAGVKADVIGYKGSAPLAGELVGGQIPIAVDTLDALLPLHQGGKLRILATSGPQRSSFAPDVPTLKEAGVALAADGWNTFYAPRAMSAERVQTYAQAIQAVMSDKAVQKQFADVNMQPAFLNQRQTADMLARYKAQWQPVVTRSGYQQ